MFRRRRRDGGGQRRSPGREVFDDLRGRLIDTDPQSVGLVPTERFRHVWSCLTELEMDGEIASVVSLIDGTTSLYTSRGGGVIGGGDHVQVAEASLALLDVTEASLEILEPTEEVPLPTRNEVRFNVLTFQGRRTSAADQGEAEQPMHPLHALFAAAQNVITELRLIDEGTRG
jgi:hypothetical protein